MKSCKRMNLQQIFQRSKHGFSEIIDLFPYGYEVIPELGKIMVISNENIMFIIDPSTCEIVQALNISVVAKRKVYDWYPCFKNKKETTVELLVSGGIYCFMFSLHSSSLSLKELAVEYVTDNLSTDKILTCNLPQSLLKELLKKKRCQLYLNAYI